jgi:hypothetical protein
MTTYCFAPWLPLQALEAHHVADASRTGHQTKCHIQKVNFQTCLSPTALPLAVVTSPSRVHLVVDAKEIAVLSSAHQARVRRHHVLQVGHHAQLAACLRATAVC